MVPQDEDRSEVQIVVNTIFIVYKHTNLINGKAYIGWTSFSQEKRWNDHCYSATNKSKYVFHKAIRKYGTSCWIHEILETHDIQECAKLAEIRLIKKHQTYIIDYPNNGYNMTSGGDGTSGYKPSLAQRIGHRGSNSPSAKLTHEEVLCLKRAYLTGTSQRELTKQFNITQSSISRILSGKTYSDIKLSFVEEAIIRKLCFDHVKDKRKFVKESTRKKVSINRSGVGNGMFGKLGQNNPNFGTKRSEASKQLMREKAIQREMKKRNTFEVNNG